MTNFVHFFQMFEKIRYDISWQLILMKYALFNIFEKSSKIWNCSLLQIIDHQALYGLNYIVHVTTYIVQEL